VPTIGLEHHEPQTWSSSMAQAPRIGEAQSSKLKASLSLGPSPPRHHTSLQFQPPNLHPLSNRHNPSSNSVSQARPAQTPHHSLRASPSSSPPIRQWPPIRYRRVSPIPAKPSSILLAPHLPPKEAVPLSPQRGKPSFQPCSTSWQSTKLASSRSPRRVRLARRFYTPACPLPPPH
jgi:hypothetical protein